MITFIIDFYNLIIPINLIYLTDYTFVSLSFFDFPLGIFKALKLLLYYKVFFFHIYIPMQR